MSVDVVTFGCRLNAAESEVIRREAERAGFRDTVVVNTCAVTAEAVRQARQTIRALRRERPQAKIVVTGCAAQTEPQTFVDMPEADRVIGNAEKLSAAAWAKARQAFDVADAPKAIVNDIMAVKETAAHLVDAFSGRARAFVQVQNGCDHRCTFCIIPYGRGNSRSVPMGAVVEDVRRLTDNGYREVVLTGVDITAYGADLPGAPKLGTLVKQILKHVPELPRLRPDVVFGADLIAGFPTETEAMLHSSFDLVEACGLTHLHVFPFSPRPGTPAARMPQLPRAVIKERAMRLRERGAEALVRHLQAEIGASRRVLAESPELGRTEQFTPVKLAAPAVPGEILDQRIASHDGRQLLAA